MVFDDLSPVDEDLSDEFRVELVKLGDDLRGSKPGSGPGIEPTSPPPERDPGNP